MIPAAAEQVVSGGADVAAAAASPPPPPPSWLARYPGFAACVLFAGIFFALFRSDFWRRWRWQLQEKQQQHQSSILAPVVGVVLALLCYLLVVYVAGGRGRRV